jgi:hypothetical protein
MTIQQPRAIKSPIMENKMRFQICNEGFDTVAIMIQENKSNNQLEIPYDMELSNDSG